MLATGVTLVSSKRKLEKIEALPPARSIFGEFLEFVYLGKPTSLPHSEIYRICEITRHQFTNPRQLPFNKDSHCPSCPLAQAFGA